MKYPDETKILKILKDIENKKITPTRLISKDATVADRIKFNICQRIVKIKREQGYKNTDIAQIFGVTPAVVSRVIHCDIEKFKIDSLLFYYESLLISTKDKNALKAFREDSRNFLVDPEAA